MVGRVLGSLVCAAVLVVACGDSSTSIPAAGGGDGGVAEGSASTTTYTLDNVCEKTVPIVCDIRKPCCTSGVGYDDAGCVAHAQAECEKDVARARAGQATFHPERIDACIPQFRTVLSNCSLSFDVLQNALRTLADCRTFEGQVALGSACTTSSECVPATKAGELVSCDDDTKKCKATTILAEGASCSFADGFDGICDEGLYCDVDFSSDAGAGICKKKTSIGVTCDKDKKVSLECGLSNYCEPTSGKCVAGKDANVSCESDFECVSIKCNKTGQGSGTCGAPKPITKPEECKGP